jgi:hypothetical protein
MTTLKELKNTLQLSEAWHGERPVRVLTNAGLMEIDEIHDIGFNGGAEGVILVCKTESGQKVPLPPSLMGNGSRTQDGSSLPATPSPDNTADWEARTSPQTCDGKSQIPCGLQAPLEHAQLSRSIGHQSSACGVGVFNSSTNDERMHHYQRERTSITGFVL